MIKTFSTLLLLWLRLTLILFLLIIFGCKKATVDKEIEGFWQLTEFTTLSDNTTHKCSRIYYSIQLWVVEIAEKGGNLKLVPFIGRYKYNELNDSLSITDISTYDLPEYSRPASREELLPYGLDNVNSYFKVIEKGNGKLVLKSDYATLHLRRF